jgi:hypothetical protein
MNSKLGAGTSQGGGPFLTNAFKGETLFSACACVPKAIETQKQENKFRAIGKKLCFM